MTQPHQPKRRQDWQGERSAVLVRMPAPEADRLRRCAQRDGTSVSQLASRYLAERLALEEGA